jgi:hypothetical protein
MDMAPTDVLAACTEQASLASSIPGILERSLDTTLPLARPQESQPVSPMRPTPLQTIEDHVRDDVTGTFNRSQQLQQLAEVIRFEVASCMEHQTRNTLKLEEQLVQLRGDFDALLASDSSKTAKTKLQQEAFTKFVKQNVSQLRADFDVLATDCTAAGLQPAMALQEEIAQLSADVEMLKREQLLLEKSVKDPMRDLLTDIAQLRGTLLEVGRTDMQRHDSLVENQRSACQSALTDSQAIQALRQEILATCPDMGSMQMELFSVSQNIQKQIAGMLSAVRQEFNDQLADFGTKVHDQNFEAIEGAIAEVRQTLEAQGKKVQQIDGHVQKLEGDFSEPVLESLPQLAAGVLKMLHMLGIASDEFCGTTTLWRDSSGPLNTWREACADLPRMLDHAWLRLRLKKDTTMLKLIRQKADMEQVRELQTKLEACMMSSTTSPLYLFEPTPPVPPNAEEANSIVKPPRRPLSAGRRLTGHHEVRFGG